VTYRRTVVALGLVSVAVAVPSAAWLFAGERQLDDALVLREKSVRIKAQKKGVVLAERLATRFELLREDESRRPFYHYQNLFHDPEAATQGDLVLPSPLALGPADPLIAAHFQVDADGVLTLPTINDEFPELGVQSSDGAHCDILAELAGIAFFCLEETVFGSSDLYNPLSRSEDEDPAGAQVRTLSLPFHAWRQHLEANTFYAELTEARSGRPHPSARHDERRVRIAVWPFTWHTLPVGGEPGLVALRKVETPAGTWTQGFVISTEAVARQHLVQTDYPVLFAPWNELGFDRDGEPSNRVLSRVSGTPWGVALDVSEALGEATVEMTSERGRFERLFLLGAAAAALAGLLVVAMVYQSERLALQRAQFAAAAAHELRTPLAGLRLYGEMLAEGLGNPERAREYARRMASEAERLGRVVTNVLSFTRLERESLSVHPTSGDLAEAVGAAVDRQRGAIEGTGARLDVEIPDELPPVTFDRDAVSHIVQNLLENAEKYTRGVADREIRLRLVPSADAVALQVADNGDGVPAGLRRRLFRPFSRGHGQNGAEGLGLGLVLVKALADAQGGDVRYQDRPAGGAEFIVTFPV
jgi:signal transduction histidine kinase